MSFDRKDFTESIAVKHQRSQQALIPMAQLIAGAAPVMDKLQRTEEWARFCTYLQGVSEKFAARKQVALEKLGDPTIVEDREIRKLRQDIFIADVSMDTLKFAVERPAAILKGGEEADLFIRQFEKKNETTANT